MAQKSKINFKMILFILTYSLSCFTITTDNTAFPSYLRYTGTLNLLIKFAIIFAVMLVVTVINRKNAVKCVNFSSVFLNITTVIYAFDYYSSNVSGSIDYYRMWWLSAIFITQAGFYIGLSVSKTPNFNRLSRQFWLYFLPTYIFTFLLIFARTPNTYFEVNLKLGQGLISQFDYLKSHFSGNTWPLFNFVGNVAFFIPIAFMIKAIFPKIKNAFILLLSATVPFFVEGYQYIFKCGSVDIDDIVFNLSGILIGFIIFIAEQKINKKQNSF